MDLEDSGVYGTKVNSYEFSYKIYSSSFSSIFNKSRSKAFCSIFLSSTISFPSRFKLTVRQGSFCEESVSSEW